MMLGLHTLTLSSIFASGLAYDMILSPFMKPSTRMLRVVKSCMGSGKSTLSFSSKCILKRERFLASQRRSSWGTIIWRNCSTLSDMARYSKL